MPTGAKIKDTTHVEVATLALMFLYPTAKRKWGMRITVNDDGTAGNNTHWILSKGLVDTSKSNNANWQKESALYAGSGVPSGAENEIQKKTGSGFGSSGIFATAKGLQVGTVANSIYRTGKEEITGSFIARAFPVVDDADVPINGSVTISALIAAKDADTNTGFGGTFTCTWIKNGAGLFVKIGDNSTLVNNTGGTLTVTSDNAGAGIPISVTVQNTTVGNWNGAISWEFFAPK